MEQEKTPYQIRKERSFEMAKMGIEPAYDCNGVYWMPSQNTQGKKYRVTLHDNGWCDCECPDNKKGNLCKHIILLKFFLSAKSRAEHIKKEVSITKPCPECGSSNLRKDGTRKTTMGKKQRWLCMECGKRFVLDPVQNIKGNIEAVTIAMDLYMKGVSYRGIKDSIEQILGLKVTHVTIMRWIQRYMAVINEYVKDLHPNVGYRWMADEQKVNINGKWHFMWNCMDSQTRFLLANKVTETRTTENARALFQEAKRTANKKACKIVTDGSFAYNKAVTKEFWQYENRFPHERYVSLRQQRGNNNKIERYHGTFRQRDKVMKGFGSVDGTDKFAENWKTYYNFVKPHEALKGRTPANASGLKETNNWKELLIKSLSK